MTQEVADALEKKPDTKDSDAAEPDAGEPEIKELEIGKEPDEEEKQIQEPDEEPIDMNPTQLLDQLFVFIKTDERPLNPVLSGYFSKLVSLLLQRKQKLLIPYIFNEESDIIERLLYHVYQKSISELLNKLISVMDVEFESPTKEII